MCFAQTFQVQNFVCFLKTPQPPSNIPTVNMKSSGKVLTSIENIRKMEAREKEKQEKLRLKEERKKLREEKKKVKVKSKKKGESFH